MITPKQIADKTMSKEKRATAKNDLIAFYIGRPLSYILTIPFLYMNIKPNTITLISIIPQVIGFVIFYFANSKTALVIAWFMFFLWNLLDGVDGNVARYKKQFSKLGSVYDAMSGYLASALSFFSIGIVAAHFDCFFDIYIPFNKDLYIVLGGLSALFTLFPRLIMHKTISTLMEKEIVNDVADRANFGLLKTIALNLKSTTGGAQALMLVAVICGISDAFTMFYFLFNTLVMLASLRSILKEK